MADITVANSQKDIVTAAKSRLEELARDEGLQLRPGYDAAAALRTAILTIQGVKDSNGKPALEVCTKESVINALLYTAVMGLYPQQNQIYYIVYGNKLQAQRSYFGTMAAVKRIPGVKDVWAAVVCKGDKFTPHFSRGKWIIGPDDHQPPEDFFSASSEIVAAYCIIEREDGDDYVEIMRKDQIDAAWAKSRNRQQTTHKEFPDQMAKKTVIQRGCKPFVNTCDEASIFAEAFNATGEQYEEADQQPATRPVSGRQAALNSMIRKPAEAKEAIPAEAEVV